MKPVVIGFGLLITSLLILFKIASLYHVYNADNNDAWIAGFSILFLVIGMVLSRKLFLKTEIITKQKPVEIHTAHLIKSGISKREAEVLLLMHEGLSQTVKKHISNIFIKLQVQRRTEAVKKALELSIIA